MDNKIKRDRCLVAAIVTGCLSVIPGFLGLLFLTLGIVFRLNPYNTNITINGVTLHGEEAAAEALKLGKIFLGVGGGSLAVAVVLAIVCAVLLIKVIRNR